MLAKELVSTGAQLDGEREGPAKSLLAEICLELGSTMGIGSLEGPLKRVRGPAMGAEGS
jgi:hypothetical protein